MKKIIYLLMSLSFVAFASCSDDKDNPVNNENTWTENSNGGNGGSNDNGSQLSNDSQPKNGSQPGNVAENSSSVVYYSGKEGGRSYVDLGLTSGTKWATCNVGATKPEEYGNYYAWGETATKETYGWNTYKYGRASNRLTKYCDDSEYGEDGFTDNKTTLELSDDAAYMNWGGKWRMPTKAQQDELRNECYWVWTESYNNSNVKGYIVYKAKVSSDKGVTVYSSGTPSSSYSLSDVHIFLPVAGAYSFGGDHLYYAGARGFYLSSSLTKYVSYACAVFFSSDELSKDGGIGRNQGYSVRAVFK